MSDELDQRLALWMRPVTTTSDRITAVHEAILSLSDLNSEQVLELILLAHGDHQQQAAELLRAAVASNDAGFAGDPRDLETQIVAAAAIADRIASDSDSVGLAARCVASARFLGLKPAIDELPSLAEAAIVRIGESWRRRASLFGAALKNTQFKDLDWSDGRAVGGEDLQSLLKATTDALTATNKALKTTRDLADARLTAADEEIDLLWWVISKRVDGDGAEYATVGAGAGVLAGLDVYVRLGYNVELPRIRGLLRQVLPGEQVVVGDAIEAAQPYMKTDVARTDRTLLPLLSALGDLSDVDGDPAWRVKAAQRNPGLLDLRCEDTELAVQLLREKGIVEEL